MDISPVVKRPEHEADICTSSNPEVCSAWLFVSTFQCAFIACYL